MRDDRRLHYASSIFPVISFQPLTNSGRFTRFCQSLFSFATKVTLAFANHYLPRYSFVPSLTPGRLNHTRFCQSLLAFATNLLLFILFPSSLSVRISNRDVAFGFAAVFFTILWGVSLTVFVDPHNIGVVVTSIAGVVALSWAADLRDRTTRRMRVALHTLAMEVRLTSFCLFCFAAND
jgi:hypothetical protein